MISEEIVENPCDLIDEISMELNLRRQKYLNSRNVCKVSLKFTIFELQKKFHTSVSCTINFVKNE